MTGMINKIIITAEAVFDYEHCIGTELAQAPAWADIAEAAGGDEAKAFAIAERYEKPLRKFKRQPLKAEAEEYIDRMNAAGRLLYAHYFTVDYFDDNTDAMLTLVFFRRDRLGVMQFWELAGISLAEDLCGDMRADDLIRHWLKAKITDTDTGDWVLEQQLRAEADKVICGYGMQGRIECLPEEVKNAIQYGTNQELAEAVSVLQNASGKRAWRRYVETTVAVCREQHKRP
jgi:hypothetical protein